MCLSCVKVKPKDKIQTQELQRPSLRLNAVPKSNISFQAQDYNSKPFVNQSEFVLAKHANAYAQSQLYRDSHYDEEAVNAKQSKLIKPKQLLNYDLDAPDGVSKVPVTNTFHYESLLNHFFLGYPKSSIQRGNSRYHENSQPQQNIVNNSRVSNISSPVQVRQSMIR